MKGKGTVKILNLDLTVSLKTLTYQLCDPPNKAGLHYIKTYDIPVDNQPLL